MVSFGVILFLWQEDVNIDDGVVMIEKLFVFFDIYLDVFVVLIFSIDGFMF